MKDPCKSCVVEDLCEKDCSDDDFEGVEDPCGECLLVNICEEDCQDIIKWRYWLDWNLDSLYIAEGTESATYSISI